MAFLVGWLRGLGCGHGKGWTKRSRGEGHGSEKVKDLKGRGSGCVAQMDTEVSWDSDRIWNGEENGTPGYGVFSERRGWLGMSG